MEFGVKSTFQWGQWVHRSWNTNCVVFLFLSGGSKIELLYKLIRIREALLAWNFFKTLQLKQRMNWGIIHRLLHCLQIPKKFLPFCREDQAATRF